MLKALLPIFPTSPNETVVFDYHFCPRCHCFIVNQRGQLELESPQAWQLLSLIASIEYLVEFEHGAGKLVNVVLQLVKLLCHVRDSIGCHENRALLVIWVLNESMLPINR